MPTFRLGGDPCIDLGKRPGLPFKMQRAKHIARPRRRNGYALSNTPSGVSSTTSLVPAGHRRRSRIALGRMI